MLQSEASIRMRKSLQVVAGAATVSRIGIRELNFLYALILMIVSTCCTAEYMLFELVGYFKLDLEGDLDAMMAHAQQCSVLCEGFHDEAAGCVKARI